MCTVCGCGTATLAGAGPAPHHPHGHDHHRHAHDDPADRGKSWYRTAKGRLVLLTGALLVVAWAFELLAPAGFGTWAMQQQFKWVSAHHFAIIRNQGIQGLFQIWRAEAWLAHMHHITHHDWRNELQWRWNQAGLPTGLKSRRQES